MSPTTSKRWCPTPEQLMILEELYTRGLRTPNSTQIQKITAHLAFYGKIQGKNVFYWFQNHKARDRQKLRKKLAKQFQHQQLHHMITDTAQNRHSPFAFDLQAPAVATHPLFHFYPAENIAPQVTMEDACDAVARQPWSSSSDFLPTDWLMRTYGHDSMMIADVGPIYPCCPRDRPLQTLQLFPLRSDQETATS